MIRPLKQLSGGTGVPKKAFDRFNYTKVLTPFHPSIEYSLCLKHIARQPGDL